MQFATHRWAWVGACTLLYAHAGLADDLPFTGKDLPDVQTRTAVYDPTGEWLGALTILRYDDGDDYLDTLLATHRLEYADTAVLELSLPMVDGLAVSYRTGEQYLPFTTGATHLVSDPLAPSDAFSELLTSRKEALVTSWSKDNGLYGSSYLYATDDTSPHQLDPGDLNFGSTIGFLRATEYGLVDVNLGFIRDRGTERASADPRLTRTGVSSSLAVVRDQASLLGELIVTREGHDCLTEFTRNNRHCAVLHTWLLETGWTTDWYGYDTTFALGYQGTRGNTGVAHLARDRNRFAIGFRSELLPDLKLGAEILQETGPGAAGGAINLEVETQF